MKNLRTLFALLLLSLSSLAQATVVYSTWSNDEDTTGNYILSVTHVGNQFSYNLTINPWNAEALGIYIDLGDVSIGNVGLISSIPAAPVTLFTTDSPTTECGTGCKINGLVLPPLGGGDWEMIFHLGNPGYEGIQTFAWLTNDFGLDEDAFGLVAIRAQILCSGEDTLPGDVNACTGNDKAYGYPEQNNQIPEPTSLVLLAMSLLSIRLLRRRL